MLNVRYRGGHRSAPGNYSFGTEETTVRHRETFLLIVGVLYQYSFRLVNLCLRQWQ